MWGFEWWCAGSGLQKRSLASLSTSVFCDMTLVAWIWPWWEYFHHRNQKCYRWTLSPTLPSESELFKHLPAHHCNGGHSHEQKRDRQGAHTPPAREEGILFHLFLGQSNTLTSLGHYPEFKGEPEIVSSCAPRIEVYRTYLSLGFTLPTMLKAGKLVLRACHPRHQWAGCSKLEHLTLLAYLLPLSVFDQVTGW